MNSKAPSTGSRSSIDPRESGVDPRVDARQQREDAASSSLVSGPRAGLSGGEAHAALSGDLHDILGNSLVRAALTGMEAGPGMVVEDALTLGAAGMQVADSTAGLFSNSFMQGQLASSVGVAQVAAAASSLSRHGMEEEFSEDAGQRVNVALKRGGRPLPDGLRAKMEAAFGGADFSGVRIHTDGAATAAARGIRAHAFAVGEHVYFGSGEFRPDSRGGQELLAHELTHVVQHQEGRIRASSNSGGQAGGVSVSSPTDSHEREAEAMATQVVGSLGSVSEEAAAPDGAEMEGVAAASAGAEQAGAEGGAASAGPADAGQSMSRDARGPMGRRAPVGVPDSSGQALPSQVAAALGAQLGSAVRSVRVHTGPEAAQFAQDLNAKAVTVGQDIYFNRGYYRPGTTTGDELIAHEAHHAVIGGGAPGVSQPGDAHEREAVAFGEKFIEAGGSKALARMGMEAPSEQLVQQVDDRLSATPRGGPDVAAVDRELASEAQQVSPAADLGIAPVSVAQGSSESMSRDLLTAAGAAFKGSASSPSSTTSGTEEVTSQTFAELVIAGKVYRVKVPPSTGQTATANTDLDARPVPGVHLTGATINISADGVISGGTARGKLDVEGFFEGTDIALGILPGGAIAPAIGNLPIKVGPASGTMDLSITEAGLAGAGTVAASELGLPEWVGIRGGDLTLALADGKVSGGASLTGTTTAHGTAVLECQLADHVLTSTVTYTVTPNYEPLPGVVVNNAVLTGTLTTPLKGAESDGGAPDTLGPAEGPATDAGESVDSGASGSAASEAGLDNDNSRSASPTQGIEAALGNASPESGGAGGAESTASGAQAAMQAGLSSAMGGEQAAAEGEQAGAEQEQGAGGQATDGGAPGGEGAATPASRDPNAFLLRGRGTVTLRDWVSGDIDIALDPVGRTYDLSGQLSATKQMQFGELLAVQSTVSLAVQQNVATQAAARIDFQGPNYAGVMNAAFDIQQKTLQGAAVVGLVEDWVMEGEWGTLKMLKGGSLDAMVLENKLVDVNGRAACEGSINAGATPLVFNGHMDGRFDGDTKQAEGTITALTMEDFLLPSAEGSTDQLTLLKEASIRGEVKENKLDSVKLSAAVRYDREGTPFLEGELKDAEYAVQAGTVSGKGTFTLLQDLERKTADGKWAIRVLAKTNVDATVKDSVLTEIGGDITVQVDDDQGPLANGVLSGAKIDVATWETSGVLKLTTARKFYHPGEGQLTPAGFNIAVMQGSGINATVQKDELTKVGGDLRCMISDEEGALARVRLEAQLDLETEEVSGKGTLALARQQIVAENLAGQGWTAKLKRGSKGVGHLEKGEFTKVSGELKGQIDDEEGKFLSVDGTGEWTTADDKFSMVGKIGVEKEKNLADGGDTGWSLTLMPEESNATATIEQDVFKGINGTIVTMVRKAGTDFSKVQLGGSWTETDGFTGKGQADLLSEIDVATIGDYKLSVEKGSGAEIEVQKNDIEKIGGTVPMRLDDQGTAFIKGKVEGTYQIEEKQLDGSGQAEVLVEKHLGTMGSDQLWLVKSSGATVTIAENQLTEVGGAINLSVRDGEGEYARIALGGTFDAAGGTGFTGQGGTQVVRDNMLFEASGYSFWLKVGGGAVAHIEQNELKRIDGSVPFMVKDGGPETLIEGAVTGVYDPVTGEVTGTGAVYLGRDLTYDLGSGVQLKLLKGSGGDADVNRSKLERLGGTLTAEIWKDGEGIVRVAAAGEYNVLTNTLTRLSGSATLLKPLELLGGDVVVSNVVGTATIENNELVEAGGRGDLLVKPLNNMQGWFELNWSTQGGVETYEGTGNVEFTLITPNPATGRGMSGEVGVTASSDGTFEAVGEIDYQINDIIGGKLQVQADQTWNPMVYGNINVDTNLVDARDLFKMEGDLVPEQTVTLPYGLALFYGMKGGMGMALDALRLQAGITVGNWHPLQEGDVPQFQSNLDLTWGMNFNAMVVPYLGLGGDIGFASAQMGVKGEVELNAPVKASAGGEIKGEGGGFYGELSVGISIAPTMDLALIPYIKGEIPELFSFEQDLDRFEQPLGKIFEFEWGGTYGFGDTQYKNQAPITPADVPAPTHKNTKREGKPSGLGIGNGGGGGQAKKGAPQLESGSEIAGQQGMGGGEMEKVMETLNDIIAVVEGIGAAGELFGMLAGILSSALMFGPAGLIVHLVWSIFKGDLSWDKIKTAVQKVVAAISAAGRLLRNHFPGWWNSIIDVFNGEKPGLLDALFGADDRMREAVGRGDHNHAPYELHVEMVKAMKGGWLSTDDANCIAQVFAVAARRGWLNQLVDECGGADDFIDGWSTGFDDAAIKAVFRRNGIRWG